MKILWAKSARIYMWAVKFSVDWITGIWNKSYTNSSLLPWIKICRCCKAVIKYFVVGCNNWNGFKKLSISMVPNKKYDENILVDIPPSMSECLTVCGIWYGELCNSTNSANLEKNAKMSSYLCIPQWEYKIHFDSAILHHTFIWPK